MVQFSALVHHIDSVSNFLWSGFLRTIDKLYTQIGNVNRLHNIIEPFAALF